MTTHILTYVKRSLTQPNEGTSYDGKAILNALVTPGGHGTNRKSLFNRWKHNQDCTENLVIWLVSLLKVHDKYMAPSIDARIAVQQVYCQDDESRAEVPGYASYLLSKYKYAFVADPDPDNSRFFPLHDARPLLEDLRFASKSASRLPEKVLAEERFNEIPLRIWTPRVIRSDCVSLIEEFAEAVKDGPTVFISYRWAEATEYAYHASRALNQAGIATWWDRWTMPRSVVEDNATITEADIQRAIYHGFSRCQFGLILRSSTYDNSKWTRLEEKRLRETKNAHIFEINLPESIKQEDLKISLKRIANRIKSLA